MDELPAQTDASRSMSRELRDRGFRSWARPSATPSCSRPASSTITCSTASAILTSMPDHSLARWHAACWYPPKHRARAEMTALELISLVTQVLFVGLFVAVLWDALRQRSRAGFDTALLFGSVTAVVLLSRRRAAHRAPAAAPIVTSLLLLLLNLAPYAMIRLAADFSGTPRWIQVARRRGIRRHRGPRLCLHVAAADRRAGDHHLVPGRRWLRRLRIRAPERPHPRHHPASHDGRRHRRGPLHRGDRRRLPRTRWSAARDRCSASLASSRRWPRCSRSSSASRRPPGSAGRGASLISEGSWSAPSASSASSDDRVVLSELQQSAAAAFGATGASIGLADADRSILRYVDAAGEWLEYPDTAFIAGRAFTEQRRVVALRRGGRRPGQRRTPTRPTRRAP